MNSPNPALSEILFASSRCLAAVQTGHSLTEALAKLPSKMRPAAQAVAWYAMRHWGLAQAWRDFALSRQPKPWLSCHVALTLLLLDAAMIEHGHAGEDSLQSPLDQYCPRYAPHTLVDQAVRAAELAKQGKAGCGLVNAVLRRFQRERPAFLAAVKHNPVARWNHPAWWIKKLKANYPKDWQTILDATLTPPKLVLRINRRLTSTEQVLVAFHVAGYRCRSLGQDSIMLEDSAVVSALPGFTQGHWSVQDQSAQLAAPLLGLRDGLRVLDACAAPGGKTAHLLELADVKLTALDHDSSRLARVKENLSRLQLMTGDVTLKVADARALEQWWDRQPFDAILADVPCTASGVVRRHPDIAWLRRESDVSQTTMLQREILDALWQTLAPGGRLLLVTCSVFPEEGEGQAQAMLTRHADAIRLPAPGQILPEPATDSAPGHDGFFYAAFERKALDR
ncbi:16S rRNA (cytosine(967)-C(5))-methyltransferase RsmB [Orrella daihaiensis]|uniref:16S rRNA (Cytosine(967)-C(5))-methyltransferase RsmB n=1 Tax=Orrella daihaiensis TaxID=2782176 RepID=A0ABY4AKG5_9BURK|nr:16S rRNA (cytosine(967)-C(5))-methyltransferase RsmB [Orrella daihaiensis]UOD50573.1 16S rRNA (cytosine(967)-C(5))-methyltransferase RsmB [Orrella daihaiensis]